MKEPLPTDVVHAYDRLVPLRDALLARGNALFSQLAHATADFAPQPDGWVCRLSGPIDADDWAALVERFEIPPTIGFLAGAHTIRDSETWADIRGDVHPR